MKHHNALTNVQSRLADGGHKLLRLGLHGSRLYGTDTAESDTDYKGIFLPSMKSLILGTAPKVLTASSNVSGDGKNTADDVEVGVYSLQYFFYLLSKGDTNMVDILFSYTHPTATVHYEDDIFYEKFREFAESRFLGRDMRGMVGYLNSQAAKYSFKGLKVSVLTSVINMMKALPADTKVGECAEDIVVSVVGDFGGGKAVKELVRIVQIRHINGVISPYLEVLGKKLDFHVPVKESLSSVLIKMENSYGKRARQAAQDGYVDLKAIYHAFRVLGEIKELHETGRVEFPSRNREFLLSIREGKYTADELTEMLSKEAASLEELTLRSVLPEKFQQDAVDEFILSMYD